MTENGEKEILEDFNKVSIKIKNYMCFSDIAQGFGSIKPINIIIGRNNSGKSRMMDLLQFAVSPKELAKYEDAKHEDTEILLSFPLVESELRRVFPEGTSGGEIGGDFWRFGKKYIGHKITMSITKNSNKKFVSLDPPFEKPGLGKYEVELTRYARNPFSDKIIKKITAERDIEPNAPSEERDFHPNGSGATNIIELFLNDSKYSRDLVDDDLLSDLNKIVSPDVFFESITVKRVDGNWEIFLKEKDKGPIPLSNSGSGLKTILLVLINIILVPKKEGIPLSRYIFVFEELENNLHPAIQRRLLAYIRDISMHHQAIFFITTHSNVVIDLFSKDRNAQIYHVVQNASVATAKPVTTYIETSGILDDLDIRASDLLQSNGLIWVEGPSDRIYINRLIELWSDGSLAEGLNYQCVFYGGRVLAHLSAETDVESQKNLLNILLTNRNVILLMDSDKESDDDAINATKERVREEIQSARGLCWITAGRTIENYIPAETMKSFYNLDFPRQLHQYEDYRKYLEEVLTSENKKFYKNKVLFAERMRPHLSKNGLEKTYDLSTQMPKIINEIKKWNKLE